MFTSHTQRQLTRDFNKPKKAPCPQGHGARVAMQTFQCLRFKQGQRSHLSTQVAEQKRRSQFLNLCRRLSRSDTGRGGDEDPAPARGRGLSACLSRHKSKRLNLLEIKRFRPGRFIFKNLHNAE